MRESLNHSLNQFHSAPIELLLEIFPKLNYSCILNGFMKTMSHITLLHSVCPQLSIII